MSLPTDYKARKDTPIVTGCYDYFPDALAAVARLSKKANEKHNPGQPLHWSKEKSNDHADCLGRHLAERGKLDEEMQESHTVHVAWRALALLQTEIEGKPSSQADADGWIQWRAGMVAPNGDVCVRYRYGGETTRPMPASWFTWAINGSSGDIVAYKVVT